MLKENNKIHFIDVWGENHPGNEQTPLKSNTPSFDEVPPGEGAGGSWEK